jgi:GrpB-like predicted nucleotidyltransferase (UPF0157 family)
VEWLAEAGLGLDHDVVRLDRTTRLWVDAGARLRHELAHDLRDIAVGVEQIGSASVEGLLAKPIIDLAIGLTADQELQPVRERLVVTGWIYRGDSGGQGGHLFVLETKPWHRVAHAHVVEHDGDQWNNYLRLRDLLRRSPGARQRYEATKLQLIKQVGGDRTAYTDGKTEVVTSLLDDA